MLPRGRLTAAARNVAFATAIALTSLATTASAWTWSSSDQWGTWTDASGAVLENDVWGPAPGWSQTIYANSHSDWQVVANLKAQQYIASYPHAKITINQPADTIGNAAQPLLVDFNAVTPAGVSFDQSFDLWFNGTSYEVMIWNSWSGVSPIAQSYNANGAVPTWSNVTIAGVTYEVYTGAGGSGGSCISFLPHTQIASGTVNISAIVKWISSMNYWSNPTFDNMQLGWEIVNTYGATQTFTMKNFTAYYGSQPPPPTYPLYVSAGGPANGSWIADAYYSGGTAASTTSAIDTSALPAPVPPQSVVQNERYGAMTYTFPGATAGATYTVNLLFSENYWTAAGQRQFNVAINGTSVLSNFDIFAAAGAKFKAIQKSFTTTANASGQIVVAFTTGTADLPKVDGIEVVPNGSVVTPVPLYISAGGPANGSWIADAYYSGGSTASTTSAIDTSLLSGLIPPQSVLQDERYGAMTYTVPGLAQGNYTVTLVFSENYWTAAGQRQFNVAINGAAVLTNFDIYAAAGGRNKAIQFGFPATVGADGNLAIQFTTGAADLPKIDGIEIAKASTATFPIPFYLSAGGPAASNFVADAYYSGGTAASTTAAIDSSQLTGVIPPQSVLQHERYGAMTYTFPGVSPGWHTVTLVFSENYWTAAGKRLFNVAINGTSVLSGFDIYATAGGMDRAIQKTFTTNVGSDGNLTIQFTTGAADYPKIDGIEVTQ